ncbi:ROK family glucokinase [Nocardioides sp. CFH 31398]|uniref:ROK family glucokinase n=1 Tax=Nocardioides sp. CFH 31398 TaxID=2919579 RepID=UPI001F064D53|nr:ROK family glucokinase [Nocardioides sp. CFH 31398]MCH1868231.1 ROK family glucokinase [Nocardioides sp. CFH 31398]
MTETRPACGIDIGGTKIAGGVVDADGTILRQETVVSPATDSAAIEKAVADLVAELGSDHDLCGVGVGAAGFVDKTGSTVMFAPNLAWRDEPLRRDLEQLTGLGVVVENDANAAAWGEFCFGAASDADDLLMLTLGTGVGGGMVTDGELYRGGFGVAGELGHLRIERGGRPCGCGNLGCLEQYASGTALVRGVHEAAQRGVPGARALVERAGGDAAAITGPMVTEAALGGDRFALEHLATLGRWLGEGVAIVSAVLDPAVVLVGGGVAAAGDLLLDPAREVLSSHLTGRGYRPEPELRVAVLGGEAGMIGAADLARRRLSPS